MDADTLRLILFIIGCLVVLGIYLWDRYKRTAVQQLRMRLDRKRSSWKRDLGGISRQELRNTLAGEPDPHEMPLDPLDLPEDSRGARRGELPQRGRVRTVQKIQRADAPAAGGRVQEKILQLFIQARDGQFTGEELFRVARGVGLRHGEMDIFHFHDDTLQNQNDVVFSVASMVNPGTIPIRGMADFSTPGLAMFARLPGAKDGMKVFQDMLYIAGELSEQLNGEVLDETRATLTREKVEQIRTDIIAHRDLLQGSL